MTVDQRLEFLLQGTESLHDQVAQLVEEGRKHDARLRRQEAAERKHRLAVLVAMRAYIDALNEEDEE